MQLGRNTVAHKFNINKPIWHTPLYKDKPTAVGLNIDLIEQHNEIEILYVNKAGRRIWPHKYYFDGRLKIFFKTQEWGGRTLLIVPIYSLQELERV